MAAPKEESSEDSIGRTSVNDFATIDDFTKHGSFLAVNGIKAINSFPSGRCRDLYCAHPSFGTVVDSHADRILGIIANVLKHQNIKGNIQWRQPDEKFELLLECNDSLLERINCNLDELSGISKHPETILVQTSLTMKNNINRSDDNWNVHLHNNYTENSERIGTTITRLITAKNIPRPQIFFKIPIDNSATNPFEPKIKVKPNALKPLAILAEYNEDGSIGNYLHPYHLELAKFQPCDQQLCPKKEEKPQTLDDTPLVYIEEVSQLKDALDELQIATEIAVDLEHHSYRSFQGITCLLQLSTQNKDYIFDTFKLRDDLHILNEVFTNPKVVKIFHGAECDIEWLQRDLSLYVVNMFDTHQAAKILGFPRLSLAYLLKKFVGVDANKRFQLADWRIRPLPIELLIYARQDTHFLIYIYKSLVNMLLEKANQNTNLLENTYQKSTEICKRRYLKSSISPDSHMDLYRKSKKIFDNRQLIALKEIFHWRDRMARQEDESYGFVLPNHMLMQISESLPREMQGILACCNPIPPLVKQNLHVLHQIVLKAREQSLIKPIIEERILNREAVPFTKDFSAALHCPHDLSQNSEFRDDLPTLLDSDDHPITARSPESIPQPTVTVFETYSEEEPSLLVNIVKIRNAKFITPYERYIATIPMAEKQRLEESSQEVNIRSKLLCPMQTDKFSESHITIKGELDEDQYKLPLNLSSKRKRPSESEDFDTNNIAVRKAEVKKFKINHSGDFDNDDTRDKNSGILLESAKLEKKTLKTTGDCATNKLKNKERPKITPTSKTAQSSDKPIEFDYSKVDFNKYKGGSGRIKCNEITEKFAGKGKNKKVADKTFNKLISFASRFNKKK